MSPSQGPVGPPPWQGAAPSLPWNLPAVPPAITDASTAGLGLTVAVLWQARGLQTPVLDSPPASPHLVVTSAPGLILSPLCLAPSKPFLYP